MTHPNRGGHAQKTEKPDFRIQMNRDGSEKKITYIKSYISYNRHFINFFVRPLLLGAPLLIENRKTGFPDFRIRMNRDGSEKKITYIKSYMSYNWYFINLFVRPILLGAAILEKPDFRISGSG